MHQNVKLHFLMLLKNNGVFVGQLEARQQHKITLLGELHSLCAGNLS